KDDRLFPLNIDEQLALEHQKELVFLLVLVPMKVALDYSQPHDGLVHLRQGLVEPGFHLRGLGRDVDALQLRELDVDVDVVTRHNSYSFVSWAGGGGSGASVSDGRGQTSRIPVSQGTLLSQAARERRVVAYQPLPLNLDP